MTPRTTILLAAAGLAWGCTRHASPASPAPSASSVSNRESRAGHQPAGEKEPEAEPRQVPFLEVTVQDLRQSMDTFAGPDLCSGSLSFWPDPNKPEEKVPRCFAEPDYAASPVVVDEAAAMAVVSRSGISWEYRMGGCQNRAHALAAELTKAGIEVYKIFAIAPSWYSTLQEDPISVSKNIPGNTQAEDVLSWDFHVAVLIHTRAGERVLDPALSARPLTVAGWISASNCENCAIVRTNKKWLEPNTSDQIVTRPHPDNPEMHKTMFNRKLATGEFTQCYPGVCQNELWIERNLALNRAGAHVLSALRGLPHESERARSIREVLGDDKRFRELLTDGAASTDPIFVEAKQIYEQETQAWKEALADAFWRLAR